MASVDLGLIITGTNNASSSLKQVAGDVKNLGENAQAASNRLKAIQVVIAGILLDKTLEFGKAAIAAAAATQNLDIRMAAMAGGATKATQVWDKLAASFAGTPFSMDTISAAWTRLRVVVGQNDKTTDIISAITNDVAVMGGKEENIDNLSNAFTRLFTSGVASSREYRSILQQTGLTIGDLATAAGVSSASMQRSLSKGFESATSLVDAFIKASNQRFGFFAQNLTNSVGGAYNLVFNTFKKGLSDIGQTTDLNAHITVFFQNLAGAVDKIMHSFGQKDIDKFFDTLKLIEPLVVQTGKALLNLATAIVGIGSAVVGLLSGMSADQLEFGMLGYFLFGKKGAALATIVYGIGSKIDSMAGVKQDTAAPKGLESFTLNQQNGDPMGLTTLFTHPVAEIKANIDDLMSWFKIGMTKVTQWSKDKAKDGPIKSLFGNTADIDKIKKAIQDLQNSFKGGSNVTPATGNAALADALNAARAMSDQLRSALAQASDKMDELTFKAGGDQLGSALSKAKLEGDGILKGINSAIDAESKLQIHTAANAALVADLKKKRDELTQTEKQYLDYTQKVYDLEKAQFVISQQQAQLASVTATTMLKITSNQSATFNMFSGTSAGQNQIAVLQEQLGYLQQIETIKGQIAANDRAMADIEGDPTKVAALTQTNALLHDQLDATQNALHSLSAVGKLTQQLWQNLGQTMENDVASGITGILTGTETLGDALRQIFSDMISMSIKFLLQLLEMQIFGQTAQAASLATAGPTAAAMTAIWGPAAMAASIATFGGADATGAIAYQTAMATSILPFANGGVPGLSDLSNRLLSGPTMFGVGGEAGTEAVMPLTRIGGKLGVRAEGGSSQYHIHVSAIDTQSGMQFIAKNIETIDMHLQHRKRLNRSAA